jgi:transposase
VLIRISVPAGPKDAGDWLTSSAKTVTLALNLVLFAGIAFLGNTNAATSVVFLQQLRSHHSEPLIVIWDNGPAHHGPEIREYLTTPDLKLRLVALPGYSPDFNPDEAIWEAAR